MTDPLLWLYRHLALTELGGCHDFTAHLSPEIEARARACPAGPMEYLTRRINRYLKAALGRSVEWFGVIEQGELRRLHLHGEIALRDGERDRARAAIRRACGEWGVAGRNKQVVIRCNPDAGWSSYCTKEFWRALPVMRGFGVLSFSGRIVSCTRKLNRRAQSLYEAHRVIVMREVT